MWAIVVVSTIYLLAFVFGTLGNFWVMASMIRSRVCHSNTHRPFNRRERSRIFVFALAIADFLVLLTIPFFMIQILHVKWPFGDFLCRLHAAIDFSGKFFSVVILTAMSIERYLLVCTRWRYVTSPMMITLIPLSLGVIFCVIIPIVPQVIYTTIFEFPDVDNPEEKYEICLNVMPDRLEPLYLNYTFMVGFAIPLSVMAFCYIQLVQHVRKKFRKPKNNQFHRPKYMCGVTRSICRIAVFHFTCWAPFWFVTLAPIVMAAFGRHLNQEDDWFNNTKLFANMLPYINSAGNCILYAFLNADIRQHIIWRPTSNNGRSVATSYPSVTISLNPSPTG